MRRAAAEGLFKQDGRRGSISCYRVESDTAERLVALQLVARKRYHYPDPLQG
jgi:hypothetical protein